MGCRRPSKVRIRGRLRAYTIVPDGHFRDCETLSCDEESDAIEWAKQLITDYTIELRCGGRFVAKLEPRPE